jgi:hypothetical protein
MEGYIEELRHSGGRKIHSGRPPRSVTAILERSLKRRWHHLAEERIEDVSPEIPLGQCFWPLSPIEKKEIKTIFSTHEVRKLGRVKVHGFLVTAVVAICTLYFARVVFIPLALALLKSAPRNQLLFVFRAFGTPPEALFVLGKIILAKVWAELAANNEAQNEQGF